MQVVSDKLIVTLHEGQQQALRSPKRIVLVLAGTQGGKTSFGPVWLYQEIQRRGPGDYLVVTPVYPLLELKALPVFRRYFEEMLRLGTYTATPTRRFTMSDAGARRTFGYIPDTPTRVLFGYAADPDSLESATVKAAWLDEAGQRKFKLESWEAIQRRLAIYRGRVLITTTPYDLGWIKTHVYDRWRAGDPEIDVVHFESIANPAFPRDEYERARATLPSWKFDLFYRAIFTRPAGLVYDSFDPQRHVVIPFEIPHHWKVLVGIDFGGVHTAAVFLASDPQTGILYCFAVYRGGRCSIAEHVQQLTTIIGHRSCIAVGGSLGEDQWRREMAAAGFPVVAPKIHQVDIGIERVYARFKQDRLVIFASCVELIAELETYRYALDAYGRPVSEIEDKHDYHVLDALRYVVSYHDHPITSSLRHSVSYYAY